MYYITCHLLVFLISTRRHLRIFFKKIYIIGDGVPQVIMWFHLANIATDVPALKAIIQLSCLQQRILPQSPGTFFPYLLSAPAPGRGVGEVWLNIYTIYNLIRAGHSYLYISLIQILFVKSLEKKLNVQWWTQQKMRFCALGHMAYTELKFDSVECSLQVSYSLRRVLPSGSIGCY